MSDDDDKRPPTSGIEPEAEASEAEASSDAVLTADPEDRETVRRPFRRPGRPARGVTWGRLGVMVLAVASLPVFWWVILHSGWMPFTGDRSMPVEEDPVVRLSKDVAGLRADIQLFEERLDRVEALGAKIESLSQRLDEREAELAEQRNAVADQQSRRESLESRLEQLQSQAESHLASLADRLSSRFDGEAAEVEPEAQGELHDAIQLEVLHLEPTEVGDE